MRAGKIIPNGVSLEKHESETVVFFTNLGKVIELIPPSNTPHARRPDFIMDGLEWEMKSPVKGNLRALEHLVKRAIRQSGNIIVDLRRIGISDEQSVAMLEGLFNKFRSVKRLWLITKKGILVKLSKK